MAASPDWSEKEIATLRQMYPTHIARDIALRLGRTRQAVAVKAFKLGLKKPVHPSTIIIPASELMWLKLNYAHLTNKLLCMRLCIKESTLHRLARKYRLTKSKEFMKDCQAFTAKKAYESHMKNGTFPPKGVPHPNFAGSEKYQFKPGHRSSRWERREE